MFDEKEGIMRLRMYVTLPDVASARGLANDLLLARIEHKHMRFLARRGTDLGELNEASYLQKTDAVHGAFVGLVIGGVMGALIGALLGVWVATMVGLQVPNSRLKAFERDMEDGRVLLMLDVPSGRYEEVRDIIARKHPEAMDRGNEPTVPAFP